MKNKVEKIAVIGHGYVGKAVDAFFSKAYEVLIYDPAEELSASREDINDCEMAVICVPTPMKEDGMADLSAIESTFKWLDVPLVLIKSTVPPGTTEKLNKNYMNGYICFSPEFIGEGKYFIPYWKYPHPTKMEYHDFFIIGGEEPSRTEIVDVMTKIFGPSCRILKTTSTEAELIKYMENSWGATKVTFANEFYEIARVFKADWQVIREGFLMDGRTERIHTMVRKESRGFGGKCFPKDVNAIVKATEDKGYEPNLLKQVLKSNDEFRSRQEM